MLFCIAFGGSYGKISMNISKIDSDSLLAQLRAGATLAAGKPASGDPALGKNTSGSVDFGAVLKNSLDQVNNAQQRAAKLAQDFELGAPEANLTEAMITMQKASISFQYTLQVRNKLVAAYQEIMNMPI